MILQPTGADTGPAVANVKLTVKADCLVKPEVLFSISICVQFRIYHMFLKAPLMELH